jgi:hypothetical protein
MRDLKGQFLDDCLIMVDPLSHRLNGFTHRFDYLAKSIDLMVERLDEMHQLLSQGAQLLRGQMIDIWERNHAADFARAGNSPR